MSESDRIKLTKVFLIENQLTTVYLEHFGGKPSIHIKIGDYRHIYFRQLRRYHTIGTFHDLTDDLIQSWAENNFTYNLKCSCKIKMTDN